MSRTEAGKSDASAPPLAYLSPNLKAGMNGCGASPLDSLATLRMSSPIAHLTTASAVSAVRKSEKWSTRARPPPASSTRERRERTKPRQASRTEGYIASSLIALKERGRSPWAACVFCFEEEGGGGV